MKTLILVVTTLLAFQANAYTYTCEQVADITENAIFPQADINTIKTKEHAGWVNTKQLRIKHCEVIRQLKQNGASNSEIFDTATKSVKNIDNQTAKTVIILNASLSLN